MDSGENRVRVGITCNPSLGRHAIRPFKEVLKSVKATPSVGEEPAQDRVSLTPDTLKVEVHFGVSPQVVLDVMSEY